MTANEHMYVARHNTPGIYFKPFVFLAMFPAINHFIFVFIPGKHIYPVHCGKTYKVRFVAIPEFVFTAHVLKLLKLAYINNSKMLHIIELDSLNSGFFTGHKRTLAPVTAFIIED